MEKIQFETPINFYVLRMDENGLPFYIPIRKENYDTQRRNIV